MSISHSDCTVQAPRVALLDDDELVVHTGSDILKLMSFSTTAFVSADQLSSRIEQDPSSFDAFVLDWYVGDGTSEAIIRTIRSHSGLSKTPVFVVSGAESVVESDDPHALNSVARSFGCVTLRKPISWKGLATTIRNALRGG